MLVLFLYNDLIILLCVGHVLPRDTAVNKQKGLVPDLASLAWEADGRSRSIILKTGKEARQGEES